MKDQKNNPKQAALDLAISHIKKQFGDGAIMSLGTHITQKQIETISTGSLSLDLAIGIGGVPRGRIIEIFGPESSGKSTLATHIVANCQKNGGMAAYIDAEHALDPRYAERIGVKVDELLISQPDCGEEALNIAEMLARSGAVDVIVIDSVAALVPKNELEGEIGDNHIGLQARLMSQALRKLTASLARSNTCAVFINQIREKVGVMFGSPETTTGGRALKFYASVRLDIRRTCSIKAADKERGGEKEVGNRVKVKVVKNKMAPPFQVAEFDILFNYGISREGDLIDLGIERQIIKKSGTWLSYKDQRFQGKEAARTELKAKPQLTQLLEKELIEYFKNAPQRIEPTPTVDSEAEDLQPAL